MVLIGALQAHSRPRRDRDITVANLNILHGFACELRRLQEGGPEVPEEERQCRVQDRIALLIQHIIAAGCPDIITLQENVTNAFVFLPLDPNDPASVVPVGPLTNTVELIKAQLPTLHTACGFRYRVVFDPEGATATDPTLPPGPSPRGIDEELILTRYAVEEAHVVPLYSPLAPSFFRHVLFARIQHPVEPVDVFTTHLAADADLGHVACRAVTSLPLPIPLLACPADTCTESDTVRECQAKQMAHFIETRHDIPGPGIITGDFNEPPFSHVYNEFAGRGWLDSHRKAKNAKCTPDTGLNCTAGREDTNLSELESRDLNQNVRIDYIFVIPPQQGMSRCQVQFDTPTDQDGDGTGTGLFASEPNPFEGECGPAPQAICWPSDHSGNQLDLNCQGGEKDQSLIHIRQ
jgi:endonuclease/exonuclease/phosphatase family metal-dependent hydrolase